MKNTIVNLEFSLRPLLDMNKNSAGPRALTYAINILLLCAVVAVPVAAQTVGTPVSVASTGSINATLAIPRWKGYMLETDPDQFWLTYANTGTSSSTMNFTTDGGATWSSNQLQVYNNGWTDYHLSVFGLNGDIYATFPASEGTCFRHFSQPAHDNSDRGPLRTIANTAVQHRSNVMAQENGRAWVFTRRSGSSSANVLYHYTDNDGANWTNGTAWATNASNVRIGSMPYVDGNPALVVLHLDDSRGYQYYHWNGNAFVERADHAIFAQDMGQVRVFTHQVVNDTVFHLIFGLGTELHHVWKYYNGGTGSWNHQVIETSTNTVDSYWLPSATVQGDDLYLFFCMRSSSNESSSQIYYKKWSQSGENWTSPVRVSTQSGSSSNLDPNTCFSVPTSSDYIPVFWAAGGTIWFNKISVTGSGPGDTIPPAQIDDLDAETGGAEGEIDISWTAPGDDGESGTAADYIIRYSQSEITSQNWSSADLYGSAPSPESSGSPQQVTLTGLSPGMRYYVGVRTEDEVPNMSPLSNVVSAEARIDIGADVDDPDNQRPERFFLFPNYPNPFNPTTTIEYSLFLHSRVTITIYNELGQAIRTLTDQQQPAGSYTVVWDGRDDHSQTVASGVYFYRLTTEQSTLARKMVFLK